MSIVNNLKWNATSQLFKIIAQLISMIYLARLISPNEYGIMAMAAIVINFALLFRDLGTSAAIVQREQVTEELKSSIFWLNFILGGLVFLAVFTLSPLFSGFYNEPKLKYVLWILSINYLFLGSSSLHLSLMERESKFKIISKIEMSSYGIGLLVAIVMAKMNFGVYSLVFQSIIGTFISSILFWYSSPWKPKFKIEKKEIKSIFNFSYQLSFFNFINYFARNLDSFLIGKYMSASILGAYNLAYRIMLFPLTSITFITNRSLFPILSQKKNNYKEIEFIYLNTIYIIWLITLPVTVSLASLNELFIDVIFGSKWHLSADILLWLAPTAIIQSVLSTTGTIFMSQGRTGILALLGIQGVILTTIAFIAGINVNIITLAKYYFIANLIHFIPCMIITMAIIKSNAVKILKKTIYLFISAFLSYLTIVYIKKYFNTSLSSLIILSAINFIIFLLLLLPTKECRMFIKNKFKL